MKAFLPLALIVVTSLAYAQESTHSSYRKSIEQIILNKCGIDVDLVQTNKFTVKDGIIFDEETTVTCPSGSTGSSQFTITFVSPIERENGDPLDPTKLSYELEIIDSNQFRLRACDSIGLCSIWVTP